MNWKWYSRYYVITHSSVCDEEIWKTAWRTPWRFGLDVWLCSNQWKWRPTHASNPNKCGFFQFNNVQNNTWQCTSSRSTTSQPFTWPMTCNRSSHQQHLTLHCPLLLSCSSLPIVIPWLTIDHSSLALVLPLPCDFKSSNNMSDNRSFPSLKEDSENVVGTRTKLLKLSITSHPC